MTPSAIAAEMFAMPSGGLAALVLADERGLVAEVTDLFAHEDLPGGVGLVDHDPVWRPGRQARTRGDGSGIGSPHFCLDTRSARMAT